jgi:hypothetical protein
LQIVHSPGVIELQHDSPAGAVDGVGDAAPTNRVVDAVHAWACEKRPSGHVNSAGLGNDEVG